MNTKIKSFYFLFLLALISFACSPLSQQQVSSSQIQGQNFLGQYEGVYRSSVYEIWIELDQSDPSHFFMLIFEQYRKPQVQNVLNQYTNTQDYSRRACSVISRSSERDRNIYGDKISVVAENELWNRIGGLSVGEISSNNRLRLSNTQYIRFGGNDEHGITDISFNANGELSQIKFLETGFIKKPWNYFRGGPRMNVSKISNATLSVLNTYNDVTTQFQSEFLSNPNYCNSF